MANQPTAPGLHPPPELPSMPDVSTTLTNYLRTFSLWCRQGFAAKLSATAALPKVLLLSPGGAVFSIAVGNDGRLTSTPIALASGDLGTPVLTFAPVTGSASASAANPPGTTSATYVMMGLGHVLASQVASRLWVTIDGRVANTTNGRETDVVVCCGTGPPPANGAPQAGTIVSQPAAFVATTGGGAFAPFSLTATVSGITPQTSYWFDLAVKVTGGTGNVSNIDACAMGLP
jgi:hypothetical protein